MTLEETRPFGWDGPGGYECRVPLPDGTLDEGVISTPEAATLADATSAHRPTAALADAETLRLLIESTRIRLAFAYEHQGAGKTIMASLLIRRLLALPARRPEVVPSASCRSNTAAPQTPTK